MSAPVGTVGSLSRLGRLGGILLAREADALKGWASDEQRAPNLFREPTGLNIGMFPILRYYATTWKRARKPSQHASCTTNGSIKYIAAGNNNTCTHSVYADPNGCQSSACNLTGIINYVVSKH